MYAGFKAKNHGLQVAKRGLQNGRSCMKYLSILIALMGLSSCSDGGLSDSEKLKAYEKKEEEILERSKPKCLTFDGQVSVCTDYEADPATFKSIKTFDVLATKGTFGTGYRFTVPQEYLGSMYGGKAHIATIPDTAILTMKNGWMYWEWKEAK